MGVTHGSRYVALSGLCCCCKKILSGLLFHPVVCMEQSGMLYHRALAVLVIKRNIDAITHKLYPKPYSARRSETEVGTLDPNS